MADWLDMLKNVLDNIEKKYSEQTVSENRIAAQNHPKTNELMQFAEKAKEEALQFAEENSEKIKEAFEHFPDCDKKLYNRAVGLHRGFLCPCPVHDLVVGNVSRKHLMKRIKKTDHYYEYNFDEKGNLSCVSESGNTLEFIVREDNKEKGFTFLHTGKPYAFCESKYENGYISSFTFIEFSDLSDDIAFTLNKYEYSFTDGFLQQYLHTNLFKRLMFDFSEEIIEFSYNDDNTYKEYTVERLSPTRSKSKTTFPVTKKRLNTDFCKPFNYFEYMNSEQK
ncbi:MAG: hypothetical protein IKJ88_07175 [Clostridia bacterium]|nr:hypothetical protein [Clostridia bacterium]